MLIYNSLLIAILISGVLYENIRTNYKYKKIYCIGIGGAFFLISGLRSEFVGADLPVYLDFYNIIKETYFSEIISQKQEFETGYAIFNKIISYFGAERYLITVISFIIIFSITRFIYRFSEIPWLSFFSFVCFGYFFQSMNVLRQYIALSIILYSFEYLVKNKILIATLLVLLAASFHKSAVLVLSVYPVFIIKNNKFLLVYGFFLTFFLFLYTDNFLEAVDRMVYVTDTKLTAGSGISTFFLYLSYMIFCITVKTLYDKRKADIKNNVFLFNIGIIALAIQTLCFLGSYTLLQRFNLYFSFSYIVLVPNYIYMIKNKIFFNVFIFLYIVFAAYVYFFVMLVGDSSKVIPYSFL